MGNISQRKSVYKTIFTTSYRIMWGVREKQIRNATKKVQAIPNIWETGQKWIPKGPTIFTRAGHRTVSGLGRQENNIQKKNPEVVWVY